MNNKEVKEKLHQYIDNATDEELEEMLSIVEEDTVEYGVEVKNETWHEDKQFVKDMEQGVKDFETGKDKGIPWEEVHTKALERIKKKKDEL